MGDEAERRPMHVVAASWRDFAENRQAEKPWYKAPMSPKMLLTDCRQVIDFCDERAALIDALETLTELFVDVARSQGPYEGDPEQERIVLASRALLAKAELAP